MGTIVSKGAGDSWTKISRRNFIKGTIGVVALGGLGGLGLSSLGCS